MGKLDVSEWKNFKIGDLFEVEYGRFTPKDKLGTGSINYVTTSGFNNGITDKIEKATHNGNCITVASDGALMGVSFYQKEPFATSNIVSTLTPKKEIPLNSYIAHFICTLIRAKRSEFSWLGFKMSVDRVRNLSIPLPVHYILCPDFNKIQDIVNGGGGGCCYDKDRYIHLERV